MKQSLQFFLGTDFVIAVQAREQVYGREFSWFALGAIISLGFAIYSVIAASKKKEPNQPLQRNASTGSVSNFESPARRG
ncbi:MAG: hypothetical protein QM760_05890 [Nibricoccus sp.]